jgi:hypothetical protein
VFYHWQLVNVCSETMIFVRDQGVLKILPQAYG